MEITTFLLGFVVLYTVALVTRWTINRKHNLKVLERYGIPGPPTSFLGGNMFDLRKTQTPNEVLSEWLKKYGDVFGYYIAEFPFVVINDLDILKQIFIKDFNVFCNRPPMFLDIFPLNNTILVLNDTRWKEIRTILTPTFSSGKIKLMTSIIDKKADVTVKVVEEHANKQEMFDIYQLVQGLTLDVIADCALATKTNCQTNLQDIFLIAVRDFFRYSTNAATDGALMFPIIGKLMSFLSTYFTAGQMTKIIVENVTKVIAERRKTMGVKSIDILQLMLEHNDPNGSSSEMTDNDIIANAYIFLLAGYETTATSLAFTFYLLITHPEIQDKLFEEINAAPDCSYNTIQSLQYLDQVFSESLRIFPPVTGFLSRNCSSDYSIGKYIIPKGANVQAPVWEIHHDPKYWPDPWKFDPDRFSHENRKNLNSMAYMPFGIGRRNCIGARFAQLEAKLAVFRLIKKFRLEKCEKTEEPLSLICPTVIINPANGVYLRAVKREETL